jgi:uncharacterized protein (DUF362 family)
MAETSSAPSLLPPLPVALLRQPDYARPGLGAAMEQVFAALGFAPARGARVLVKPNLVAGHRGPLACSEPAVVAAACAWLLDQGAKPWVADSPAFGTAALVARQCGLAAALRPLGLSVRSLGRPAPLKLDFGAEVGLSRDALEADAILSLPRLKAHCQTRITAGVKNLFGCVCGMRKALAHSRFGDRGERFESMLLQVALALPRAVTLLDAVRAMHVTGPTGGAPINLGFLAASHSPVALDTAAFTALHLTPAQVPTWAEAQRRNLPGAWPEHLAYPLLAPGDLDCAGFQVPDLDPVAFRPGRLIKGACKRLALHFTGEKDA